MPHVVEVLKIPCLVKPLGVSQDAKFLIGGLIGSRWRVRVFAAAQKPEPGIAGKSVAGAFAEESQPVAAEEPGERDE